MPGGDECSRGMPADASHGALPYAESYQAIRSAEAPALQGPSRLGWCVFFISTGLLGFELCLMRVLLVASWHHFAFLVISIALLGFGASGTALCLFRTFLVSRGVAALVALALAAAVSMVLCLSAAQYVPVEGRVLPTTLWRQLASWGLYWVLLGTPFLLGAAAIGLALILAGSCVPRVYAANLIGSATGLAFSTLLLRFAPPEWLAVWMAAVTSLGAMVPGSAPRATWPRRVVGYAACALGAVVCCAVFPPHIRLDPYKYGAYVRRLVRQGEATQVGTRYGPRGLLEVYRGESFHDLPFLSLGAAPPPVAVVLADGHYAGSVLEASDPDDAEVVDHLVSATPYALLERLGSPGGGSGTAGSGPRVLLLGESGGSNVWLAARFQTVDITIAHSDANLSSLVAESLRNHGGQVFQLPGVRVVPAEPRHFVDGSRETYDLIQLVTMESSAAGSGGIGGLAEDHLVTVEGIATCVDRLTPGGVLAVTRGIQTPHRDNLKLFATLVAAARRAGIRDPAAHLVVVRDYLAVCTMFKRTAWSAAQVEQVRRVCAERQLTPVWFPGIRADELNHPDAMDGPSEGAGDWLHYAVVRLLSPDAERFIRDWPFHIRPATDDRPFFLDFCKLNSLHELKRAFGELWLTRVELAFLIVLAAIVFIGAAGMALTLLPLLAIRAYRRGARLATVLSYFCAIGLAYILLEMAFLSRMSRWTGDPISAAAVTIGGFLFFSGMGSLTAQRLCASRSPQRILPGLALAIVIVGLIQFPLLDTLAQEVGSLAYLGRCGAALAAILPLGYLMGFPMPLGLARLHAGDAATLPWAWGINGFASVIAAPIAVAMGMTWGYRWAAVLALGLYLIPALLFRRLPTGNLHHGG